MTMEQSVGSHKRHSTESASPALKTSPLYRFEKSFPYFREPGEIGTFSLDADRQFHNDKRQLKSYFPPKDPGHCRFDLKHGYEIMIHKDESVKEYLHTLLQWIMESRDRFVVKKTPSKGSCSSGMTEDAVKTKSSDDLKFQSLSTDFVCWRGLLTKLLCVPYEKRDGLMLAVIKFRGTYYMCEFETESKKLEKQQTTPRQEQMCAWGFKFEQYVVADKSSERPDTSKPVNTNEGFCTIVRSRLESHSLVFGAEVDCEDPWRKQGNKYVELKTSRLIDTQRQHENFCRFKLIKWWAQSFLVGIPVVICGFRDDNGVVHCLQNYPVKEMPALTKDSIRQPWKPNVCFNFLKDFLDFVKSNITEDNERCAHVFRWGPGKDMTYERRDNDEEFNFLPQWFVSWDAWDKPV
ncbi:decapping and exoribonuclease protein isoform X2 [Aplysia californica]|nr:decapping and exoribonuclease protein isoform X2 [Aplysia californica]